ncbi:hypothetical protein [Azoarcus sp. KH32C]|uniref:hypothetical protein n=1 Tax=Azoarcus sp. KH32C TaxID=748247 RepID=UPI0002385F54|nr:hypothetical protein [Azoarcus sp. KH32C]BAL26708.1 hypothetical protein AZKH_4431 [Azoarcus sp. KH32C]
MPRLPLLLLAFACALPLSANATDDAAADADAAELARAAALRDDAKSLRGKADAELEAQQIACRKAVLVNRCVTKAKEARLVTVRKAREMEIEASKIETGQKRRAAAESGRSAGTNAPTRPAPETDPAAQVLPPDPSVAETQRERQENAVKAVEQQKAAQKVKDAAKARERAKANADAAERAAAARGDKERYDRKLRKYQEDKAQKEQESAQGASGK